MAKRQNQQIEFFRKHSTAHGGELFKTRSARLRHRPLDSKYSMHLTLRSSKAVGDLSFKKPKNAQMIKKYVDKFSQKYGIKVISLANVGNHLHFHIKLSKRATYKAFIRALTGAIALSVSGKNRWSKEKTRLKFWDYRPFTRVVYGFKAFLRLQDYIEVNQLEGLGVPRKSAVRFIHCRRWLSTA